MKKIILIVITVIILSAILLCTSCGSKSPILNDKFPDGNQNGGQLSNGNKDDTNDNKNDNKEDNKSDDEKLTVDKYNVARIYEFHNGIARFVIHENDGTHWIGMQNPFGKTILDFP